MKVNVHIVDSRRICTSNQIKHVVGNISKSSTLVLKTNKHPEANCLRNFKMVSKF